MRILACVFLALTASVVAQAPNPLLHKQAPQFVRTDVNQGRVDLSAYKGRVVLVNFWATWCAPCQSEMPRFVQWRNRYRAEGLQIIGVSMDDDPGPVVKLVHKRHVNYPVIMGDAELGTLYGGVLGLPVTFLIDRQGNVAARYKGETNLPAMEREVQRLLRAGGE
jgi:thiol-disulfide isomerase/thioredoxin